MQNRFLAQALPDIKNTGYATVFRANMIYEAVAMRFPLETSVRGYDLALDSKHISYIPKVQFDNNFRWLDEEKGD